MASQSTTDAQNSTRTSTTAEPLSFPNPSDITDQGRPSSMASRMTEELTDYGDNASNAPAPPAPAVTAATPGENAGSRPSSANTVPSSRGNWSHGSPQGRPFPGSYAGSTGAASTRPPTAHSRTHVPSLTAQAFYRPMSSQRLQAQRSSRLPSVNHGQLQGEQRIQINHNPSVKETMVRPTTGPGRRPLGGVRPISHASELTEFPRFNDELPAVPSLPDIQDRQSATNSPNADSEAPLEPSEHHLTLALGDHPSSGRASHLNLARLKDGELSSGPLSPNSFRSSMRASMPHRSGHEKLPSEASTIKGGRDASKELTKRGMKRKNYEYFPGNTVFCLGGRLQNTKGRPVNLATAILLLLPVGLFYAFS
jgi:palmitoyltransferase ZDHHC9/14/18